MTYFRECQDWHRRRKCQSPLCPVLVGQKDGRKNLRRSRKHLLSAAMAMKRLESSACLLNDLKNHKNQILIFSNEKTFTVDPVFNKQNYRVARYRIDISEHCKVSTTVLSVSTTTLGVVSSNERKMPTVWFERGYKLIFAVYREVWRRKSFHRWSRLLRNQITPSSKTECPYPRQILCRIW